MGPPVVGDFDVGDREVGDNDVGVFVGAQDLATRLTEEISTILRTPNHLVGNPAPTLNTAVGTEKPTEAFPELGQKLSFNWGGLVIVAGSQSPWLRISPAYAELNQSAGTWSFGSASDGTVFHAKRLFEAAETKFQGEAGSTETQNKRKPAVAVSRAV